MGDEMCSVAEVYYSRAIYACVYMYRKKGAREMDNLLVYCSSENSFTDAYVLTQDMCKDGGHNKCKY